jgi:hypothetical protein
MNQNTFCGKCYRIPSQCCCLPVKELTELTDAQNTIRQLAEKLECYERLVDSINMASNPMGVKSRVMLRNVREMKTIMTKEEEIRKAVEAEREACAEIAEQQRYAMQISLTSHPVQNGTAVGILNAIRARGDKHD